MENRLGGGKKNNFIDIDIVIISSQRNFYARMKFLETQGVPYNQIVDGRVFKVPNLDFPRLLKEGVAYGVLDKNSFSDLTFSIYPRIYSSIDSLIKLDSKSYVSGSRINGRGFIIASKFSSIASDVSFNVGSNADHNYKNVNNYGLWHLDWHFSSSFKPPQGQCKILIGNDVWIGRGCFLKCTNPDKPLIIGDGAVIASDSVVVKNVPPYAIVGGNPAQIIKYRFPPDVIESLLRIKWWDWSLDKIHDNFKYFNDIERFIALHDK